MKVRPPIHALAAIAASALAFGGLATGQESKSDKPAPTPAIKQAFLGVATAPVDPSLGAQLGLDEGFGLLVHHIDPGSPADAALEPHDVITKFNDQRLVNHDQLAALVRNAGTGATVSLTMIRAGKEMAVDVALVEREVPAIQRHSQMPFGMHFLQPPDFGAPGQSQDSSEFDSEAMERQMRVWREQLERWEQEMRRGSKGRPQVQTQSGSVTTTNKMRNATWVENGLVLKLTDNGQDKTLTIDRDGKRLFEGPINTTEQREKIPEDVRGAVERLEGRLNDSPKIPAPTDAEDPDGDVL